MTSSEIRASFLNFFQQRGHRIVPSAPVIPHGDPTLLFTNAGMNQFKDVFLGTGSRDYVRAADTQKCIRVSGKHNDLEEVGRDTYHHTFFEMLGNWSFGDYYKEEAIGWAWELLTREWGLDKRRLFATVFETDDEAAALWRKATDITPSHILKFGKKDNFWEMGETGPCGPCSEIHIDLTADGSGGPLVNAGDARVMEIWNLVFIQNNRNERGELEQLPARHVDTGMGFERVCAVLQGKPSNYDTDVFMPIIDAIAAATARPYSEEADRVAMRVIADHIRMLTFAIADGAIPGNEGRGYVLRRILRRAARFGRSLGMREPFIYGITGAVVDSMGHAFPDIVAKRHHVERVIRAEEEGFNQTLDRGLEIFEQTAARLGRSAVFPGDEAFRLYDTFGFPLDLTQLMAQERGLTVDTAGFDRLMEEQRTRARDAGKAGFTAVAADLGTLLDNVGDSRFVGYERMETRPVVEQVIDGSFIALSETPFYVESGGQVDDTGIIRGEHFLAEVIDSVKRDRKIVHEVRIREGDPASIVGARVLAQVDVPRRLNIQRNHSATHLVHEALRRVLGPHVQQQGSLVAPDHLRFDFPHFGKITPEELRGIEEIVNQKIADNIGVHTEVDMPIEQARHIPNVKMFFGEKYGEIVRVVFIDEAFSVEFCGGTHVPATGDIGMFKIVSEESIASGVRRIVAVTGDGVQAYIEKRLGQTRQADDRLAALVEEVETLRGELSAHGAELPPSPARPSLGAIVLPPSPSEALRQIEQHLIGREHETESLARHAAELKKQASRYRVQEAASGIGRLLEGAVAVDGINVVFSRVQAADLEELKSIADRLREQIGSGVGVLGAELDGKAALVCVVSDDLVKQKTLQAGKIVGELAKRVGGGGGGKPHLATAGGKDPGRLDETLKSTPDLIRSMLQR
jgi:alanyl-tRNA synthetase